MKFVNNINFCLISKEKTLIQFIIKNKFESIILPGGKTLNLILKKIKNINKKIKILITDERISTKHIKKLNTKIFSFYQNKKNLTFSMPGRYDSNNHLIKNFRNQFNSLNKKKAGLFIGMGLDGHICSIFNNIPDKKNFIISKKKNENFHRITISKKYISSFNKIYLIAFGSKKGETFSKILNNEIQSPINSLNFESLNIICDKRFYQTAKKNLKLKFNLI